MSTTKQKYTAFNITRILIFVLIVTSIYAPAPVGDVLGVIAAAAWLWLPKLISLELLFLDKLRSFK